MQNFSELEEQELKQREDYLKKKRDLLMATKKESRNNVLAPPTTEQKKEQSSPKEVKDSHIESSWPLIKNTDGFVKMSMLLLNIVADKENKWEKQRGSIFKLLFLQKPLG